MSMHDLIRPLVRFGLSEKEAAVYVALLALGSATVQAVSAKAVVNRVTTYATLETLVKRGLASTRMEKGKRVFFSETPHQLSVALESEKAEVAGKAEVLRGTLPMLMALFNTEGPKPSVRFLEGEEGLESVRQMFLGLTGDFVQIVSYDDVLKRRELILGSEDHLKHLKAQRVRARAILIVKDPAAARVAKLPEVNVRLVSAELLPMRGEITVRGSMIFLYAYYPTVLSVIVTSKEMAASLRALFELAWKGADKISSAP